MSILESSVKVNEPCHPKGRVQRMIANIENTKKDDRVRFTKTKKSEEPLNMPEIIDNLLDIQLNLRNDLKEINWSPKIVGYVTRNNTAYASVTFSKTYYRTYIKG